MRTQLLPLPAPAAPAPATTIRPDIHEQVLTEAAHSTRLRWEEFHEEEEEVHLRVSDPNETPGSAQTWSEEDLDILHVINLPRVEDHIGELTRAIEDKTNQVEQLKKHTFYIEQNLAKQQKDLGQLTTTKQQLETQLTALQQTITTKEKEITGLATQNRDLVRRLETTKRDLEARLAALQQTITAKADEYAQLAAQNHELQDRLRSRERDVVGRLLELQQLQEQSQAQRARIKQLEMQQSEQQRRAAKRAEQARVRPARARLQRLEQQTHAVEGVILHRRERMNIKEQGAKGRVRISSQLRPEEQKQLDDTLRAQASGVGVAVIELEQAARLVLKTIVDERSRTDAVEKLRKLYLSAGSPVEQAHIAGTLLKQQHVKLLTELLTSTDPRNLLGTRLKEETLAQIVALAEEGRPETQAQLLVQLATGGAGGGGNKGGRLGVALADEPDEDRDRLIAALLAQDEDTLIDAIDSDPAKVRAAVKLAVQLESIHVRETLKYLHSQLRRTEPKVAEFVEAELKLLGAAPAPKAQADDVAHPRATVSVARDYATLAKQLLQPEFLTALGTSFVADSNAGPVLFGYYVSKKLPA